MLGKKTVCPRCSYIQYLSKGYIMFTNSARAMNYTLPTSKHLRSEHTQESSRYKLALMVFCTLFSHR